MVSKRATTPPPRLLQLWLATLFGLDTRTWKAALVFLAWRIWDPSHVGTAKALSAPALVFDGKGSTCCTSRGRRWDILVSRNPDTSQVDRTPVEDAITVCSPTLVWFNDSQLDSCIHDGKGYRVRLRRYREDNSSWGCPLVFGAAEKCLTCTVSSSDHHLIIDNRSEGAKSFVRLIKYNTSGSYTIHSTAQLGLSNLDMGLWLTYSDMNLWDEIRVETRSWAELCSWAIRSSQRQWRTFVTWRNFRNQKVEIDSSYDVDEERWRLKSLVYYLL